MATPMSPEDCYPQAPMLPPPPSPRRFYFSQLWTALSRGNRKWVWSLIRRLVRFSDDYGVAWFEFGRALDKSGLGDQAESAYRLAVSLEPNLAWGHYALGRKWFVRGERDPERSHFWLELELSAYQRAVEADPELPVAWQNFGEALTREQDWDRAIAAFQKARALDPMSPWPAHHLGKCYRTLGQRENAIAAYQQAAQLDPDFVWTHVSLGHLFKDLEQWKPASEAYRRAIDLGCHISSLPGELLHSLTQRDDLTPKEVLEQYHQVAPKDDLEAQLQVEFWMLNQHLDDGDCHRAVADRLLALERPGQAIAYYKIALALNPNDAIAQAGLDEARRALKEAKATAPAASVRVPPLPTSDSVNN